jgi:hypothetical protein
MWDPTRRWRRASRWALVSAVLAMGRPALAAVPLQWEAPPSCPAATQVQAWVDALVAPQAQGSAKGEVTQTASGFALTLVVTTAQGRTERVLEAPACESLAQAAAVVVAVVVDPLEAQARSSVARPSPTAVPAPARSRPAAPAASRSSFEASLDAGPPVDRAGRRRPRAVTLGVEAGVGTGLLPQPHATVHAWGGLAWRRLAVHVTATHRFGQLAERAGGGGAMISATTGGAELGPVMRRGPWTLRLLASLEAGAMVAEGRDLMRTLTPVSPWLGVGLRPGVAWSPAPWVALSANVTLSGSLLQPQFEIEGGPLIHRTSLLGARIGLAVEFRLPLDQPGRSRRRRG